MLYYKTIDLNEHYLVDIKIRLIEIVIFPRPQVRGEYHFEGYINPNV